MTAHDPSLRPATVPEPDALTARQPFLTRYAVARESHPPLRGHYCANRHVWLEPTEDGHAPIVVSGTATASMVTKTMTVQEDDDEQFIGLPELATKTDVQQETDDQMTAGTLLEMVTKTSYEVESDDDGFTIL